MSLSSDRPNPSERPEPRTVPSCLRHASEQRPVAFDKADAAVGRSPQGRSVPPLHMNSNDALRTFIPHGRSLQLGPFELPDRLRILLQTVRPAVGVRATQRNPIDPTYCGMQLMNFRHQTRSGYTVD